jgi:class 3 adenylate cyclase
MVNTASRLQDLTRTLNTRLVVGDAIVTAARRQPDDGVGEILDRLKDGGEHALRGRSVPVHVWLDPAPRF